MKAQKKNASIQFDPQELVRRVEGFARGRQRARVRKLRLPPPVHAVPAKEIRAIRARLGYSQAEFAALLNVPTVTAISWENGVRKPSGAALRLLTVARSHPKALQEA
jgi:putative transcriptional regulator